MGRGLGHARIYSRPCRANPAGRASGELAWGAATAGSRACVVHLPPKSRTRGSSLGHDLCPAGGTSPHRHPVRNKKTHPSLFLTLSFQCCPPANAVPAPQHARTRERYLQAAWRRGSRRRALMMGTHGEPRPYPRLLLQRPAVAPSPAKAHMCAVQHPPPRLLAPLSPRRLGHRPPADGLSPKARF